MSSTTLPLQRYLTALHQKYQALDDGAVATYIPELAKADPDWFGICVVTLADGSHQRLATLSSGMSFGEMAMLGNVARSASVHADTAVRSWTLSAEVLDELAIEHPEIKIAVLGNLSRDLAQKLRQANQLIGVLAA